ncbi:MAG TPA: hypothetical protein VGH15_09235 [Caulobacteraceae bacterium]
MTTKTLTGVYFATYDLTSPVTTLSIATSGYLSAGVTAAATGTYTLVNHGQIRGNGYAVSLAGKGVVTNAGTIDDASTTIGAGVALVDGGSVANTAGALIEGYGGVLLGTSASTLTNDGEILGYGKYGVELKGGGLVVNGSASDTQALIRGVSGVVAYLPVTLRNFGTVAGEGTVGVGALLASGGSVVNGAAGDHVATMAGYGFGLGVAGLPGTVTNYGTVRANGTAGIAITLMQGGVVTNGSTADTSAVIEGHVAIGIGGQAGTVRNFGAVHGGAGITGTPFGVLLGAGGLVTNGSTIDTSATIDGLLAVSAKTLATVDNFGVVGDGHSWFGVAFYAGGTLVNGSAGDTSALIQGYSGVITGAGSAISATNFGTIRGNGGGGPFAAHPGLYVSGGGRVTNGATSDVSALIEGRFGVYAITDAFTVSNFGSILGTAQGVALKVGGVVTNGSAGDTAALIRGAIYGVYLGGPSATVTNFGTILGNAAGWGVRDFSPGAVTNGSATDSKALMKGLIGLDLRAAHTAAKNWGTISGSNSSASRAANVGYKDVLTNEAGALITGPLGASIGYLSTLSNFGTIRGLTGPSVQFAYANGRLNAEAGSVFDGVVLGPGTVDAVSGVTTMTGLGASGKVIGVGTIDLNGGSSQFSPGASLAVAKIAVAGAKTSVEVSTKLTDSKVWSQSDGTLTVDSGQQMTFAGSGDSFAGTLTGAGKIAFMAGSDAFANVHLSATTMVVNGASITLSGAVDLSTTLTVASPSVVVAAGGATLSGGGTLTLSNSSSNLVTGATATATLTNFDKILGAGQLGGGSMSLTNGSGGVIDGDDSHQLVIAAGTGTTANAGLIENTGAGGTLIAGPIANTGVLAVTAGTLDVTGAVSGAGVVHIGGGTADFGFTFAENVTFTGAAGVLELSRSQTYTGAVTGFSKTGTTSFDLLDIASATASASYSGTTASGILTVTDGAHTAKIHLVGDYTSSIFTVSSDGHGGTKVVDPTAPASHATPLLPLVAALAAFSSRKGIMAGASSPDVGPAVGVGLLTPRPA